MKRTKKWAIALAIFLVFMWVCTIISKSIYVKNLPVVKTEIPSEKYIEHIIEADGIIEAQDFIAIHTVAGLRVDEILVHAGDYVEAGDVLYTIDMEDLDEKISTIQLQIKKIQLTVQDKIQNDNLTANIKQVENLWANEDFESTVKQTNLAVSVAEDNLNSAKRQLKRHSEKPCPEDEDLQRQYLLERESLEEAVVSANKALESVKLQQELELRDSSRSVAKLEVNSVSDSSVSQYELEIDSLTKTLQKLVEVKNMEGKIISPVNGNVSLVRLSSGDRTLDSSDISIANMEKPYYFTCDITKEQGRYISLSDNVTLKINDKKIRQDMDVTVDYMTGNLNGGYSLKCKLEEVKTTPGISASLKKSYIGELFRCVIPIECLHKENEVYYVYLLSERESILGTELYIERKNVIVNDQNERFASIESGLSTSDEIVSYCNKTFQDGQVVRKSDL